MVKRTCWAMLRNDTATNQTVVPLHERRPGSRFCEHCRSMQPRNAQPYVKGWRCDKCKGR